MINIIAQPPYVLRHLQRVSTIIRGEQIAAYMGNARLNPPDGSKDDVYVYVKPNVKDTQDFVFEGKPYLDILDGFNLRHLLNKHPEVPVIVFSELDVKTMSNSENTITGTSGCLLSKCLRLNPSRMSR